MSEQLKSVFDLPDVSFIENDTLDAMMQRLVANYEKRYKEVTGQTVSLGAADPNRVLLYTIALDLFQLEQYVDRAGKQDLLKYSYGEFLDSLGGNRGVSRNQPAAAKTTLRFTISEPRDYAIGIPAGTRVTNGDGVYFMTTAYQEIPAGSEYADVDAICTVEGIKGNDFLPGQINILVDPLPYVQSVENATKTEGGAVLESDESFAERIYLAPSGYSVAGPDDAYVFWTKTFNTNIGSVKPTSPYPCEVVIYILMADGTIPGESMVSELEEFLANKNIRPLTDLVTVKTPTVQKFSIDLTYYINRSDSAKAVTIQQEVQKAVAEYIAWQTTEIGRDINPDELVKRIKAAGAKRIELTAPEFTVIGEISVAQCSGTDIAYGGLEDD